MALGEIKLDGYRAIAVKSSDTVMGQQNREM